MTLVTVCARRVESVAACATPRSTPILHATVLAPTMAFTPTYNSPSIFEGGRLRPGIYKIKNIYHDTPADIEVSSRELHCSAQELREGRGLVCSYPLHVVRV